MVHAALKIRLVEIPLSLFFLVLFQVGATFSACIGVVDIESKYVKATYVFGFVILLSNILAIHIIKVMESLRFL
jgi:hypothetical protein